VADVRPFQGFRYNLDKVGNLSSAISPPYDVINPEQQKAYYDTNPHNIIRLELGMEFPDDKPQNNRYTRAAQTLEEWIREDVLVREERPAFYLLEHRFQQNNEYSSYWGLLAAVRLEDFETGDIRPTEIIMKGPAEDRLQLLRSCRANLSPIMAVFKQDEGNLLSLFPEVDPANPTATATDADGVILNLHVITDENRIQMITDFFAGTPLYIADGHHRYTTALAYSHEKSSTADEPANFMMISLISASDPGLTLFPTHRVIRGLDSGILGKLRGRLEEHFYFQELSPVSSSMAENALKWNAALASASAGATAFGLYGLSDNKYLILTPHKLDSLRAMLPQEQPAIWRNLDVSMLRYVIIRGILGIDDVEKEKAHLSFSPDDLEILQDVQNKKVQLGIFLNPVSVSDVLGIADAGVRMPPKSTYFYPKTPAGLVMNPLFLG